MTTQLLNARGMKTQLRISAGQVTGSPLPTGLRAMYSSPGLTIEGSEDVQVIALDEDRRVLIVGDLVGIRRGSTVTPCSALSREELPAGGITPEDLEGRFAIVSIGHSGCEVRTDRFGQLDLYYQRTSDGVHLATELDLLPVAREKPEFDQVALAHSFVVYGYRPAKRHTLYKNVQRLGIGEVACIEKGKFELRSGQFVPKSVEQYGERHLEEYADLLVDAVRARASTAGNVVYLSSGWDSTALLACLVHLVGPSNVRCVIGRMQYAKRSGIINQFEIDRARAVAEFFGVPLEVTEFDYWRRGPEVVDEVRRVFRSHQLASLTGLNHYVLAEHVAKTSKGNETIFAGEVSDGAHNLGFSQFATVFHPTQSFREYSDKMASYLFGPTFFTQFQNGQVESDAVYDFLRRRRAGALFDDLAEAPLRPMQLLASFFLRGNRFPLWSLRNARVLTDAGRDAYGSTMEATYLRAAAAEATPETLYAWYLHLYNSFHWQSSTVAPLALTAETFGLRAAIPFWDSRLQEFLSTMPESWGRGLDFNPTKYPLKWALAHRIRYPSHLQVGPHSYLYDVDPTFSHSAEILYASAFTPFFKEVLRPRTYREVLSPTMFDLGYIDGFVDRYEQGVEVRGAEMNDLLTLSLLSMVGWYGV